MGAYFKVACPGPYNNLPKKLKILKDGSANMKYRDICQKQQHYARIAYNNWPGYFEVDNAGKMVEYPIQPRTGIRTAVSYDHEILLSFFELYHITTTLIYSNQTWGYLNGTTGHWTGAVRKVNY